MFRTSRSTFTSSTLQNKEIELNLELTTTPTAEDAKTISEGLINSNREIIGHQASPNAVLEFSVFARNGNGKVTAGLRASCLWNVLHIELVWVSRNARGNGMGTALVEKAESYALEHGFEQVLIETTSWQAKPFYEKLGYKVIATLADYPKGHSMYLMQKNFNKINCNKALGVNSKQLRSSESTS